MAKTKKRNREEIAEIGLSNAPPAVKKTKTASMSKKGQAKNSYNLPFRAPRGRYSDPIDLTNDSNFYQSSTSSSAVSPVQQNLSKLFDQYRDQTKTAPDKIGIEGAQRYLTDLGVDLDEVAHLAICDLLQSPSIGEFDRDNFISGWRSLSNPSSSSQPYDTISRQAAHINAVRRKLAADPSYFKQVYRNSFKLAKPENQKSVPIDSAVDFWSMFFRKGKGGIEWNSSRTQWLDMWLKFYETNSGRPVNKDLWNMVGELVTKTKEPGGESLDWWTEDGAWPMAVDEFIASVKEKRGLEGEDMDIS